MMEIVVTGSIAYDYLMRFPGSFRKHILTEALDQVSLSFLVEEMTKHWGGVAPNIAYTMAKLGLQPRLMGTVGRDFPDYRAWLEQAGVDTRYVRQYDDLFTASFFCNTDVENNQIASFYSGAMARAGEYHLADTDLKPDLVIVSPNDPDAMSNLTSECRQRGYRFIYDPSQQLARLDGAVVRRDMTGAYAMVINEYESQLIRDKANLTLEDLRREIELLVITHGRHGSRIYTNGDVIEIPAFPVGEIIDPTGAGDAYRAGLITGLAYDLPLNIAGLVGALCASYVLEHNGPQSHNFTVDSFIERFRTEFDDEGSLEKLRLPRATFTK